MTCFFSILSRRWRIFGSVLLLGGVGLWIWSALGTPKAGAAMPSTDSAAAKEAIGAAERRLGELRAKRDALEVQSREDEERLRDRERQRTEVQTAIGEIDRQVEENKSRQDRARSRVRALEVDEHRLREGIPAGNEEDHLVTPVLERLRKEMNRIRGEIAVGGLDRNPSSPEYQNRKARLAELEGSLRSELYKARVETILALKDSVRELDDDLRSLDERRLAKSLEASRLMKSIGETGARREEIASLRKEIDETDALRKTVGVGPRRGPREGGRE